jgi:hypothetical protein
VRSSRSATNFAARDGVFLNGARALRSVGRSVPSSRGARGDLDEVFSGKDPRNFLALEIKAIDLLKVEALKAAKEKADLMLAAINKQTGDVQLIRERDNNMGYQQPMYLRSNVAMDMNAESGAQPIEMQKIKLRYEVEVHFLIAS